jgi:hypothetical protein
LNGKRWTVKKTTKKKNHQNAVVHSLVDAAKKRDSKLEASVAEDSVAASYEPPSTIEIKKEHQELLRGAEAASEEAYNLLSACVIEQLQMEAMKHLQLARAMAGDKPAVRRLADIEIECLMNAEKRRQLAGEAVKKRSDFESIGRQVIATYGVRIDQADGGTWNLDTGKMVIQRTG